MGVLEGRGVMVLAGVRVWVGVGVSVIVAVGVMVGVFVIVGVLVAVGKGVGAGRHPTIAVKKAHRTNKMIVFVGIRAIMDTFMWACQLERVMAAAP